MVSFSFRERTFLSCSSFSWPRWPGNGTSFYLCKISRLLAKNKIIAVHFDFWGSEESEGEFQEMNIPQEVEDGMKIMDFLAGHPSVNREHLWIEVPVERGEVDFPLLISRLKEKGFKGPITIEREISGEQQKKDILEAKKFLEPYL